MFTYSDESNNRNKRSSYAVFNHVVPIWMYWSRFNKRDGTDVSKECTYMNRDLTKGSITKSMLLFALPMIMGDLLQQCYNTADTLIVGQFLERDARPG